MNRLIIAQYIALEATACSVIGMLASIAGASFGSVLLSVGFTTGIMSYFFGGLKKAISMATSIAKWGWVVVPFPYDIVTFPLAFIFALYSFVFLPIIPVRKTYKERINEEC